MGRQRKKTENSGTLHTIKSCAAAVAVAFLLYIFTFYIDGEMGVILAAFILTAPVVSLIMAVYARKRIKIDMSCDGYVRRGSRLEVTITVSKTGFIPLAVVELHPDATEVFSPWDKTYRISLADKDRSTFTCSLDARIGGNGEVSVPEAYSCGFLGFVRLRLRLPGQLPEPKSVGVIPEVPEIKSSSQLFRSIAEVVMTSDDEEDNDTAALFSANTTPGYEHREYVPGDPLKRVNWKLSTKKNKLMVRLDEAAASVQPLIVLDLYRREGAEPEIAAKNEELLLCSVFGLAELLIRKGIAFGFVYRDGSGETVSETIDNPDVPPQLLLRVLAAKVREGRRIDPEAIPDNTCACVIASTSFAGDFAMITDSLEDTDNAALIGYAPECPNSTSLPLWYLDGDNSFKQV